MNIVKAVSIEQRARLMAFLLRVISTDTGEVSPAETFDTKSFVAELNMAALHAPRVAPERRSKALTTTPPYVTIHIALPARPPAGEPQSHESTPRVGFMTLCPLSHEI